MRLHAPCDGRRRQARYQRILRIVFKITAAQGISVDVHGRCQPDVHAEGLHLLSHHGRCLFHQLRVPGLCQSPADRDCRGVLIMVLHLLRPVVIREGNRCVTENCAARQNLAVFPCLEVRLQAKARRAVGHDQRTNAAALLEDLGRIPRSTRQHGSHSDDRIAVIPCKASRAQGRHFPDAQLGNQLLHGAGTVPHILQRQRSSLFAGDFRAAGIGHDLCAYRLRLHRKDRHAGRKRL